MKKFLLTLLAVAMILACLPPFTLTAAAETNGNFETGDGTNWTLMQSSKVDTEAAYEGAYGAHLIGNGSWDPMMEHTFTTVAGKSYVLTFRIKVNATGTNIQLRDTNWQGTAVANSIWFDATEWTLKKIGFTAISDKTYLQFGGSGSAAEDVYVDNVVLEERQEPDNANLATNGDFETGDDTDWTLMQSSKIDTDAAYEGTYGAHLIGNGNWDPMMERTFDTVAGKTYVLFFWIKSVSNGANIKVLDKDWEGTPLSKSYFNATVWTQKVITFTAISNKTHLQFCGSGPRHYTDDTDDLYVDSIVLQEMPEPVEPTFENMLINGDFETCETAPWSYHHYYFGPNSIVVGGKDSVFALQIGCGKWAQVRQTNIAVEPYTNYKITLWAKNAKNMSLLVKDNSDWINVAETPIEGYDDWTYNEMTFNSCNYTSVIISLMGMDYGAYGTFDNIVMTKVDDEPNEPVEPNPEEPYVNDNEFYSDNGFERGTIENWNIYQNVDVTTAAAKHGNFGAHLQGDGSWSSIMDQRLSIWSTEKYFELSFWIKVNRGGVNLQVNVGKEYNEYSNLAYAAWYDAADYSEWTKVNCIIKATDGEWKYIYLNFFGSGTGTPDDVYVDSFALVELENPNFLGLVENGDFETGNTIGWNTYQQVNVTADAAYDGSYGAHLQDNGTWGGIMDQTIPVEPGKTYKLSFWVKVNTFGLNLQIKDGNAFGRRLFGKWYGVDNYSEWTMVSCAITPTTDKIYLNFCGGGQKEPDPTMELDAYVDNIMLEVSDSILGDVDGDKELSVSDVILMQRYINGWNVTIDMDFADMNGDSKVNNKDLVLLIRQINGRTP